MSDSQPDQPDQIDQPEDTAAESGPPMDIAAIVEPRTDFEVAGVKCGVRRIRLREMLALVNVLTRGLGGALFDAKIDFSTDESMAEDASALFLLAIPNAVDEFTVFLRAIVEPVDQDKAAEVATYLMDNPDPAVLLDVFEIMAVQERTELRSILGKAQAMWSRLSRVYQRP